MQQPVVRSTYRRGLLERISSPLGSPVMPQRSQTGGEVRMRMSDPSTGLFLFAARGRTK
jgi:hypothetical protein